MCFVFTINFSDRNIEISLRIDLRFHAKLLQQFHMTVQGIHKCVYAFVWQPEFRSRSVYDTRNVSVVYMANIGKQVMLDLKIQPANIP